MDLVESVLEEQGDDIGMGLDEFDNIGIVRGFRHAHPLLGLFIDELDFVSVTEDLGEQRIAEVDGLLVFDPLLHRRHMFLNRCLDVRFIGFGQSLDALVRLFDIASNFGTMFQKIVKQIAISDEGRLNFAKNIATYLVFLAQNTGLAPAAVCETARAKLAGYTSLGAMLADISRA